MSDTPTIAPALTAEEWRKWEVAETFLRDGTRVSRMSHDQVEPDWAHLFAAISLHGQPFGFTREDVRELEEWADAAHQMPFGKDSDGDKLRSLAARIEALLPPEGV